MLKPCTDRIVVTPLAMKSRSPIVLPDTVKKELPVRARVEAVGPEVTSCGAGDVIVFHKFSGTLVETADGRPLVILRHDDVLAVDPDVAVDQLEPAAG